MTKRIDSEFTQNLETARRLLPEIEQWLAYNDDENLPEDLDDITSEKQIDAFNYWSGRFEDYVLALLTLAEKMKVCGTIRENFYDHENEKLPSEEFRGYAVGQ